MQDMKYGERLQNWMLIIVLGGSALAIAQTFRPADPMPLQTPDYTFPASVAVPAWQLLHSYKAAESRTSGPAFVSRLDESAIAGRHYQYLRKGMTIAVEMRYLVNAAVDVPSILQDSTLKRHQPDFTKQNDAGLGTYILFYQQDAPHFSACITPDGQTLVQAEEFRRHQTHPSVMVKRLLPWILGQAPLRDNRCLWVNLTIVPDTSPQGQPNQGSQDLRSNSQTIAELKTAWAEWIQEWQHRFPDPEFSSEFSRS
jgi:cyanosortase A-associated protein